MLLQLLLALFPTRWHGHQRTALNKFLLDFAEMWRFIYSQHKPPTALQHLSPICASKTVWSGFHEAKTTQLAPKVCLFFWCCLSHQMSAARRDNSHRCLSSKQWQLSQGRLTATLKYVWATQKCQEKKRTNPELQCFPSREDHQNAKDAEGRQTK